jgi:RHS repeat-associated protein
MCVRFNNDETVSTPPTVRGRVASYVWGPDLGSSPQARGNWQKAGGVGGLLMVLDGGSVNTSYTGAPNTDPSDDHYFPLWDRMGNITGYRKADTAVTSSDLSTTGAILDYDGFGRELRSSGPAADKVPFHFSSKFTDAETGLNYYGYRYYDPVNGRWLGRDPIGERGGQNLYCFVDNSPHYRWDLLGLEGSQEPDGPGASDQFNPFGINGSTWNRHIKDYTEWFEWRFPDAIKKAKTELQNRIKREICSHKGASSFEWDNEKNDYDLDPNNPKHNTRWGSDTPQSSWEKNVRIGAFQIKLRAINITWDTCGCYTYDAEMYVMENTGSDTGLSTLFTFCLFIKKEVEMAWWKLYDGGCCHE